jgi:hypothetical protein
VCDPTRLDFSRGFYSSHRTDPGLFESESTFRIVIHKSVRPLEARVLPLWPTVKLMPPDVLHASDRHKARILTDKRATEK